MIQAKLCNADGGQPFNSFIHNTTTYVGVPHDARCNLWLATSEARFLTIEAESQHVIASRKIEAPGGFVLVSELKQPLQPSSGLSGWVPPFLRIKNSKVKKPQLRLYAFRVIVSRQPLNKDGTPDATFDFHLLCEEDFQWARSFELQLAKEPAAIAPATIGDVAEGTCVTCAEVRERLRRDWLSN